MATETRQRSTPLHHGFVRLCGTPLIDGHPPRCPQLSSQLPRISLEAPCSSEAPRPSIAWQPRPGGTPSLHGFVRLCTTPLIDGHPPRCPQPNSQTLGDLHSRKPTFLGTYILGQARALATTTSVKLIEETHQHHSRLIPIHWCLRQLTGNGNTAAIQQYGGGGPDQPQEREADRSALTGVQGGPGGSRHPAISADHPRTYHH